MKASELYEMPNFSSRTTDLPSNLTVLDPRERGHNKYASLIIGLIDGKIDTVEFGFEFKN
jgi:hypothetical protein